MLRPFGEGVNSAPGRMMLRSTALDATASTWRMVWVGYVDGGASAESRTLDTSGRRGYDRRMIGATDALF